MEPAGGAAVTGPYGGRWSAVAGDHVMDVGDRDEPRAEGPQPSHSCPLPDDPLQDAEREHPVGEPVTGVTAEESPSWAEVVRHTEHGDTVAVIAHGDHVADVVPSGELDRLRETIEVLSDTDLVRDLLEGLADVHAGNVVPASEVAADLAARRATGG